MSGNGFYAPETESAIVGYMAVQGFRNIPDHELIDPQDFTDERWGKIYAAGIILHRTGREVNHLAINNEIKARGFDKHLAKLFLNGWEKSWTAECDPLLAFSEGPGIVDALRHVHRLVVERHGHEIIKRGYEGKASADQIYKELQAAIGLNGANGLPPIVNAADLCENPPETPEELIEGVLYRGSKMMLGGGSKSFKTWTLLEMAIRVATGSDWLGFTTTKGRVLYVNFELQAFSIEKRIREICQAIEMAVPRNLEVWNLRGHAASAEVILPKIMRSAKGYALIVLDPLYKLQGDREENTTHMIGNLMNEVEKLAVDTDAAVVFGSHFAKGNASTKESIDRVSGSGVFARDPDSIVTMTAHKQPGAFSVEMTLRNFAPQEPFVVRREHPLMVVDSKLNPDDLKKPKGRDAVYEAGDLLKCLKGGMTTTEWKEACGIPPTTFYRLRKQLLTEERIFLSELDQKWSRK